MGVLLTASLCALLSVVLQSTAYAIGLYRLFTFLSPVHAFCCLLLLLFLHPAVEPVFARYHELAAMARGSGRGLVSLMPEFTEDPALNAALRTPPPPAPYVQTCAALGCILVADVASGLHIAS